MNCYYCGAYLDSMMTCPNCEADVKIWKKVASISNKLTMTDWSAHRFVI